MIHGKYTTGEKARSIVILIGIIANVIIWGAVIWKQVNQPKVEEWSIPMCNQHIEWTWAGKPEVQK